MTRLPAEPACSHACHVNISTIILLQSEEMLGWYDMIGIELICTAAQVAAGVHQQQTTATTPTKMHLCKNVKKQQRSMTAQHDSTAHQHSARSQGFK